MEPRALVHLVDDDEGVRKALSRLLRSHGLEVESFGDPAEFIRGLDRRPPSCILLDLQMPGLSGLDLQAELRARRIQTPLIFITGHGDVPSSVQAMKAGAFDFLAKPLDESDVMQAIQHALVADARHRALEAERLEVQARHDQLTDREKQVLALVITGKLNKQIAADLGISEKTIKVHRARVMEKMKAASVADLVRLAERVGVRPQPWPLFGTL